MLGDKNAVVKAAKRKILVVGQAPTSERRTCAPFCAPTWARFKQLARVGDEEFFELFEPVNLLSEFPGRLEKGHEFDAQAGAKRARELAKTLGRYRCAVLLGRNVLRCFELALDKKRESKCSICFDVLRGEDARVHLMPHTSGIVRFWNDPANVADAEQFLREILRSEGL